MAEDNQAHVVLHFRNGSTARFRTTPEIDRSGQSVRVREEDRVEEISFSDLKAIYYLRAEGTETPSVEENPGSMILVLEFQDGETIRGFSDEYQPGRNGFYFYPVDRSKNDRIFVVNSELVSVEVDKL